MDDLNRDLLVALLALITDEIPRQDLSVALGDWARDRQQSLVQILLRNRAIDPIRLQALLSLSESHLVRHQDEFRLYLDQWNAAGSTENVSSTLSAPGLGSTLGTTDGLEATAPAEAGDAGVGETVAVGAEEAVGAVLLPGTPSVERFRPIRLHARGGIGQVWVARDGELQRDVALKVIQDRYAERNDQRARFVLEAEITGNLEHPGIVPVYGLGAQRARTPVLRHAVHPRGEPRVGDPAVPPAMARAGPRTGRIRVDVGRRVPRSCSADSSTSATPSNTRTAAGCCIETSSRPTSCSAATARRWSWTGASRR